MPEDIQTGVPAAEVTGEPTGVDIPGAADQIPAAEENAQQVEALLQAKQDEVAKRQQAEAEVAALKEQLLVQANPPQTPQAPQDVFAREGLENYETPTVEQIRQSQVEHSTQLINSLQFQNFITANPDYSELVGTVGPRGLNCAEPFRELIKDNPHLRNLQYAVAMNPAAGPVAYQLVKQHQRLKELEAQTAAVNEHQTEVQNKVLPLSPAAVGGGGGSPSVTDNITDEQVDQVCERIEAGEFG